MAQRPENPRFLKMLRESGIHLLSDDVQLLLKKHNGVTLDFLEAIINENQVNKEKAARLWGDSIGCAYVDPLVAIVTREAVEMIPVEIASKAEVIGLYKISDVLTVAMANPKDERMVARLESIAQCKISAIFSLPCEISDAIAVHYTSEENIEETINMFEQAQGHLVEGLTDESLRSLTESKTLTKILDALMLFAIREKASDIHMEPLEDQSRVRFRIDGNLNEIFAYSRAVHRAFAARIKVMCKLNISEVRFPQDGRFSMPMGTAKADFRVSFLPTIHGEKVVVRILAGAGKKSLMTLDKMLISQNVLTPMRRLIKSPNGIIFVTGPTGSGKTTTLYAALQELNTPDKNISTIEDPVEVQLAGLTQSQVNAHIDLSFGLLLRSLLRQDPDIILLGEIRDLETATIATEAALTGHLVLSTLHTNTAIQAIVRLIEIGIEPYMVAPSVNGVLAQRLAARVCEKCKESYYPSRDLLERYFSDIPDDVEIPLYRGTGCKSCRSTGYAGRVAFHELVLVSEAMRSLIAANAGTHELMAAARKLGYKPLRYDGLKKVLLGLTTVEEVDRHSVLEWSA